MHKWTVCIGFKTLESPFAHIMAILNYFLESSMICVKYQQCNSSFLEHETDSHKINLSTASCWRHQNNEMQSWCYLLPPCSLKSRSSKLKSLIPCSTENRGCKISVDFLGKGCLWGGCVLISPNVSSWFCKCCLWHIATTQTRNPTFPQRLHTHSILHRANKYNTLTWRFT